MSKLTPARPASSAITSKTRPSRVSATRAPARNAMVTRIAPTASASHRTLLGGGGYVRPQTPHALEPPVVVRRLSTEVFGDLGVREDEELFVADALQHDLGDLFRLEGGRGQKVKALPPLGGQHVRLDALGA